MGRGVGGLHVEGSENCFASCLCTDLPRSEPIVVIHPSGPLGWKPSEIVQLEKSGGAAALLAGTASARAARLQPQHVAWSAPIIGILWYSE